MDLVRELDFIDFSLVATVSTFWGLLLPLLLPLPALRLGVLGPGGEMVRNPPLRMSPISDPTESGRQAGITSIDTARELARFGVVGEIIKRPGGFKGSGDFVLSVFALSFR